MQEGKKWVLDYLLSGKGIDNELITHYNSLDIVPDIGDFFLPHHFFFEIKRHSDVWQRIEKHEKNLQNTKTTKLRGT